MLQSKKGYRVAQSGVFSVTFDRKLNRKGEEHWAGDDIHFHGDGRRFIYLAWVDQYGNMFRRIKLYLEHITGLDPSAIDQDVSVTIAGTLKDGTPACSTAVVIEKA